MLLFLAFLIFLTDQAIKMLVINNMNPGQSIPVIKNLFHITYIYNPGAAFGILPNMTSFFIIVSLVVVAGVLFFYYKQEKRNLILTVSFAFIIGGTLGNLFDRIRFNKVIDFIDFRIWPIFNLADIAIVLGAVLLSVAVWKMESRTGGEQ